MKVMLKVMLIFGLCMVVSCVQTHEEYAIKYEGPRPQTSETILESFKGVSAKWLQEIDEKYPVTEWFQMLIDKGVVIEDADDFDQYMSMRRYLIREKRAYFANPVNWLTKMSKMNFAFTYNDWVTFENAYIDRKIWEHQQIKVVKRKDPKVSTVEFIGPDHRTVLPLPEKSVIISRSPGGYGYSTYNPELTHQQVFDIVFKGKYPWGWKVFYLDDMSNILPERPAPISREELELPADVPWPPKNQAHLDRIFEEVKQGRYNDFGDN